MAGDMERDDAFARRISGPLRAAEAGDASFAERVMSAVRLEAEQHARERKRAWLVRPRTVRFTPLAGLALAAGLVLAVFGGTRLTSPATETLVTAARTDTVHIVRFVLAGERAMGARSVTLVGSFNAWDKSAVAMTSHAEGSVWSVSLPLAAGQHEYAFVVTDANGERWVADPAALAVRDEFGATTSVLHVGTT